MTSEHGEIPQKDGGSGGEEPVVAKATVVADANNGDTTSPAEARDLTWTDTYYADNKVEGVIAVFDIDHARIRRNLWGWRMLYVSIMVINVIFMLSVFTLTSTTSSSGDGYDYSFSFYFAFFWLVYTLFITALLFRQLKKMSKGVAGLHVAVTKDGIRHDMNRFPFGNMFRTTTIIPYNEIKAIKAVRRCCLDNTGNVYIQSSEDDTIHGISGLTHNVDAFVSLVMAMIARNAAVSIIDDVESQNTKK